MESRTHAQLIKEYALRIGFDDCGIARAEALEAEEEYLTNWLQNGYSADMDYMAKNREKRIDPRRLMEGAKSVICLLANYKPAQWQDCKYPQIAAYAYGADYHIVLKERLQRLQAYITGCRLPADGCLLPADSRKMSPDGCRLPADGCKMSPDGCRMPADGRKMSPDGCRLPADSRKMSPDGCRLPADGRKMSPDDCRLPADGRKMSPDDCRLPADGRKMSPDGCRLPADSRKMSPDDCRLPSSDFHRPPAVRLFVDTAPILERAWAVRAGLGWIGKSSLLISPHFGPFTFIAILLTDLELESDSPMAAQCGSCTQCLKACPTGALSTPYIVDARRCIAYHTIENRGPCGVDSRPYLFGCDLCIRACPHGKVTPTTTLFPPLPVCAQTDLHKSPHTELSNSQQTKLPKPPLPDLPNCAQTDLPSPLKLTVNEWMALSPDNFNSYFAGSPLQRAGLSKLQNTLQTWNGKQK